VFRGRNKPQSDLERRLRSARPEAPAELVGAIVSRVTPAAAGRRGAMRPALGLATIDVVVAVFAALGGVGYASSAARQVARKLETVVQSKSSTRAAAPLSAGQQQYGPVSVPPYPPPKPASSPPPPPPPSTNPAPPPPPSGSGGGGASGGGTQGQSHGQSQSGGSQSPGSVTGVAGQGAGQTQGSGLPFTGLSLLLPVGLAIFLIGGGILLRRRARDLSE
jgi:uncharacterized membrane protein YgcG